MRMRRKKNLTSRFDSCKNIVLSKSTNIYRKPESERYDVQDLFKLFNNNNDVEIEIGCGRGNFIVEKAKRNKDINFIGIEIIDNIIVSAAEKAEKENLENVRFFNCGAEILQYLLPKNSISNIYLNFSCPYPKKQYENHRLTYKYFLEIYKFLLKDGGKIYQKTDNDGFFEYSRNSFIENGFIIESETFDLYKDLPKDNIATEYEEKFVKTGKNINSLIAKIK
ncbi:MAG: tRNA (guanosine(46)-N7)-methyltransferase TrmB [Clostridia bacterium]|nr:tRNA (guanosine(46)-N7)-methyltransferase TrmB [Clostridia bacterium]